MDARGNIHPLPPLSAFTVDQNHNLGMCPDWEPNLQHFGVQDKLQPAEPPARAHFIFQLVYIQYYFVLVSGVQHSGWTAIYFTKCFS